MYQRKRSYQTLKKEKKSNRRACVQCFTITFSTSQLFIFFLKSLINNNYIWNHSFVFFLGIFRSFFCSVIYHGEMCYQFHLISIDLRWVLGKRKIHHFFRFFFFRDEMLSKSNESRTEKLIHCQTWKFKQKYFQKIKKKTVDSFWYFSHILSLYRPWV